MAKAGAKAGGDSPDAVAQFERVTEVAGKAQQMMLEFWTGEGGKLAGEAGAPDSLGRLIDVWGDWAKAWAGADATQLVKLTGDYWTDAMKLWAGLFLGKPDSVPEIVLTEDKRFKSDSWDSAPVFDLVRKSYLLASHYLTEGLGSFQGLSDEERKRLAFQAKQFVDAMSPANFATLNPDVIAAAQATDGESLLKGLRHLLDDLKRGKMSMTDETAFEVGRNVAATPGQVIWEGRLFQLIHYAPLTEQVFEIPLLIIPPWINKFYILDLTAEKSFIRWATEQGLSVYVVSWAQGSEALRDVGLEDYAVEGELQAIDLVLKASGAPATHVIGYCVAGTVLAATLAYMTATGQAEKVRSATFFTAQVEFSEAGDLLNFVTPPMLETVNQLAAKDGFLDGRWLATTFNMLRPTDLLWNYVVNNYLQGKDYSAFDLLYWNSDPTNVPGRFMNEYLTGLYRDNLLIRPGEISVKGVPIDLKTVQTPAYIQAGRDDHIAPLKSCFKLTTAFSGEHRFMLAGSGHIAGVVNPPVAQKYQHWILPEGVPTPDTVEAFQQAAGEVKGSWWPDWIAWIAPRSGAKVKARVPGKAKGFPAIEPAPGRYVKQRIA
ncbi:class I poly(R)-hydroxyalkanoic acid synthase [Sandaracinobacter neustonicus]|uniref:Class I poly(R)-hydroxyalkanoic acid synthase n=1 Tax=Sandaracinobacter neustonicus TaxID=1715348 RepID=A0A501XQ53_9SPHN|nr:class I poly(R)-hydroxyalkanoic acid synthase [Sandaracinobacter neustonicus]TPE62670.1 class I poly(R)-hydroxyalkanoic acid synthase [Sandaracinobacter neustonicus]